LGFAREALAQIHVAAPIVEYLDRDQTTDRGILRHVHGAHSTPAEDADYLIFANLVGQHTLVNWLRL
jgi:hypothetical protein